MLAAAALSAGICPSPAVARARESGLTADERARLLAGGTVDREVSTPQGSGFGLVAYRLVRASPAEVLSVLEDAGQWPELLPRTKSARVLWRASDIQSVQLVQGNGLVEASYAVRVERQADGLRFWLDRGRPHDIDAVWGYFRASPFDAERTLLTMAVMLDLGGGLLQGLVEGRVRQAIVSTPARIQGFVEPRAVALAGQ